MRVHLYFYSTKNGGCIERLTKPHTHSPNRERLRAMVEERAVVDNMVLASCTQAVKPNHILAKVGFFKLIIYVLLAFQNLLTLIFIFKKNVIKKFFRYSAT